MGKKVNFEYLGIKFDSFEEVLVAQWLQALKEFGYVSNWKKSTNAIELTDGLSVSWLEEVKLKTKTNKVLKSKTLLRPSEYTPDFEIKFSSKGTKVLVNTLAPSESCKLFFNYNPDGDVILEVKPKFDQNNMERLFRNNQKFIWALHKKFINLVEPEDLFKKTFIPNDAILYFKYKKTPTGKNSGRKKIGDWKTDFIPKTINEWIASTQVSGD